MEALQDGRMLFHSVQASNNDRQRRHVPNPLDKKTDKDGTVAPIPPVILYGSSRERSNGSGPTTTDTIPSNKPKRKTVMPTQAHSKTNTATKLVPNDEIGDHDEQYLQSDDPDGSNITYVSLLRNNRPFRMFLMSYIVAHLGEWLTYLASISAIEEIQSRRSIDSDTDATSSRMAVSLLIVIRLLPNVILSPFGGALADGWDRRKIMMALDVCGSLVAWIFVYALYRESVPLIYLATLLQECVAGLYEPSRSAIIPLMCPGNEEMKKATTLAGVAWSVIAAFGSAAGGFLVSLVGIQGCYRK
jgi:Na+/melibiose symporter-like transporter